MGLPVPPCPGGLLRPGGRAMGLRGGGGRVWLKTKVGPPTPTAPSSTQADPVSFPKGKMSVGTKRTAGGVGDGGGSELGGLA